MEEGYSQWEVRPAYRDEWQDAMALAWKTFMKYEADDYTPEGVKSFLDFITDSRLHRMFLIGSYEMIVAMKKKDMIGMITLRGRNHISLLFVDEKYHRKGVGRSLMQYLCRQVLIEEGAPKITVNAAPYGLEFYHKLGFRDTGMEMQQDGIRYTPMEFVL